MKKRMFAALLAVSMMIGMTACGSDNSSAGNRQLLQTRLMSLFRDSLLFTLLRMQIVAGLQM